MGLPWESHRKTKFLDSNLVLIPKIRDFREKYFWMNVQLSVNFMEYAFPTIPKIMKAFFLPIAIFLPELTHKVNIIEIAIIQAIV